MRKTLRLATPVFWQVFLDAWSGCDLTWPYKGLLLDLLRRHAAEEAARGYMTEADAAFYDQLPALVTVYRGCARYRVRGLAWTTDRDVAAYFAKGDRFDREPDRVLATAIIPKAHVFAVQTARIESEVILDPRRLRSLKVEALGESGTRRS